ncbi:MAG: FtsQ-type POTRA domain-containing protein [Oscillospiraceae bacterium]|nr:FtsQ-type POTRA domain-containing protein [Oscillospiraceae bacterium]
MGRKKGQQSGRLFAFVAVMLALIGFGILSMTVFFNIEKVEITGSSNYTSEEIMKASGIKDGDNLIRTNLTKTAAKIEKELIYVGKAQLKRVFPSTLVITITPAKAAANFITKKDTMVISDTGKILEIFDEPRANLMNFYGTAPAPGLLAGDVFTSGDAKKDQTIFTLLDFFQHEGKEDRLSARIIDGITLVDVTNRSDLVAIYDNRITIMLGNVTNITYNFKVLGTIIFNQSNSSVVFDETTEGTLTKLNDSWSFRYKEDIEQGEKQYRENLKIYEERKAEEKAAAESELAEIEGTAETSSDYEDGEEDDSGDEDSSHDESGDEDDEDVPPAETHEMLE